MAKDLTRGDLPALVLAVLGRGPLHGYGIAQEVRRLSDEALRLKEAALYPALRVLEQDGLIVGTWEEPAKGAARKVYTLTEAGRREAARRARELREYAAGIQTVLGRVGDARTA